MLTVLGPAGSISAGALADAVARRGRADARLIVAILAALLCILATATVSVATARPAVLVGLAGFAFFSAFPVALAPGALQELMPNEMRGQAVAIYVFWANVVAGGLAPTAVALVTQFVLRDPARTGTALGLVSVISSAAACVVLGVTLAPFRASLAAGASAVADQA
jgi:MFS family permease